MQVSVLIDNHLNSEMESYDLPDLNIEKIKKFVDDIRPSRLTVFAIGHDGLAQYPSKIARVAPGLQIDLVEMWRTIARERNITFCIYVSTLRNDVLINDRPEWVRYQLTGNSSKKIDHTSPYLEEWLKPVLSEINDMYKPDGFFFDGDYWAVGEGLNECRLEAGRRMFPDKAQNIAAELSSDEHRTLTVHTYDRYLGELGSFLHGIDNRLASSVNLAFTFRHPATPPVGLQLVTSDLPPFYGALESWIETAVMLPDAVRRDLVVPLYAEPEGGGRKYSKTVPQLIHEVGPLVAQGEPVYVYFPMSRLGGIDQTYVRNLNTMRNEIEAQEACGSRSLFRYDFDVLCFSDSETLQRSQDFASLRGAFLSACFAGLNVGIANTDRCLESLPAARLLILPSGMQQSRDVVRVIEAAKSANVQIIGLDDDFFSTAMVRENWLSSPGVADNIWRAYQSSEKTTIWSQISIDRPSTTFTRGVVSPDGTWRLFLWNGVTVGEKIGRHVINQGAGYAGIHHVKTSGNLRIKNVFGYNKTISQRPTSISFEMDGAYTIIEGSA